MFDVDLTHLRTDPDECLKMCWFLVESGIPMLLDDVEIHGGDCSLHGEDTVATYGFMVSGDPSRGAVCISQHFDIVEHRSIGRSVKVKREQFTVWKLTEYMTPDGLRDADLCEDETFHGITEALVRVASICIEHSLSANFEYMDIADQSETN